ncbi:hypothetical protein EVJ58_g5455 [Rhodofomes roseus]|uniref:Diphthine--ammonia ligase n=1 Tax=Rhodofomes roseus TaxID=34475 RepID=A0A4Y9YDZ9_9APHY|nr:hypothetical protein EVJ58_g5455 [Rhodofomes roseus]
MKYVALLSGGKDSCYNLLHCAANGHQLVAAASLGPKHGKEELDSYMYQTVGQDAIQIVADALEVPLYRRVISGAAVEQGNEYGARSPASGHGVLGDETEDLYALLSTVSHPDVEGVSVGAILSNYQRIRVEHVCRRLSLTPLCYLWQRDQAELLSEMIEAGMEAVLIKVAGIGLKASHLGKTLAEMQPTLTKLNESYGSHICGEGGEYETLTLDCPLFRRKIRLIEVETVIHSDNDFATVAYLRVKNAVLEPKPEELHIGPAIPPLLSEVFAEVQNAVVRAVDRPSYPPDPSGMELVDDSSLHPPGTSVSKVGRWVAVANITASDSDGVLSTEDEVRNCFEQLQDHLATHSLSLSNCANINIFISSMDLFARVNAIYTTFFGSSPPARACVAVDLPAPIRVKLDAIAFVEQSPSERQAMHVQGLSYWAPANIGPYSQAIVVRQSYYIWLRYALTLTVIQAGERIFISGQIGLIPSSLSLPSPPSLALETALSFQHVQRVTNALQNNTGGGWDAHHQGVLYWLANASDVQRVRAASKIYPPDAVTPLLYLVVPTLPKGALVERQVILHTGRCLVLDEDDEVVQQNVKPSYSQGAYEGTGGTRCHWEMSSFQETHASLAVALRALGPHALSVRLFYRPSETSYMRECHEQLFAGLSNPPPTTFIPTRYISSRDDDYWDYAMFIVGS